MTAAFAAGGRRGRKPPGPDRRQLWRTAAALMDASFVQGSREFKDAIVVRHGPWAVWVTTFLVQVGTAPITYTGASATFRGLRQLRLRVSERTFVHRALEAVGLRTPLGLERALGERYAVRGKPEARIPSLFAGTELGPALLALPKAELEVKRASRKGRRLVGDDAGVVGCRVVGVRVDADVLAGLAHAVAGTLDALERIGEARREPVAETGGAT